MPARLTPRQRAYVRKRTYVPDRDPSELSDELNIVPFLDIVVNIVMFLLMTLTTIAFFSQVEAALPEYRKGGIGKRGAEDQPLNLNVTVTRSGIIVAGSGGKLARGCETTAAGKVITVPARMSGEQDWPGLTDCVARVKEQFQDETRVTVSADPEVPYEDVIAALDSVRHKGDEELFPDVLLSAGIR
jgi:biopolymer transport protein TolR